MTLFPCKFSLLMEPAAELAAAEAANGVEVLVRHRVLHVVGDRFAFTQAAFARLHTPNFRRTVPRFSKRSPRPRQLWLQ
jgi:hypothetical protein